MQGRDGRRPRRGRLPAPGAVTASPPGFEGVRLSLEQAEAAIEAAADRLSISRSPWAGRDFNILAISGGAAGGAFGAGVLIGLQQAGRRPNFALVTGVSTGALIAPLAFLGSRWDHRLRDAYTGGHAQEALGLTGLLAADGAWTRWGLVAATAGVAAWLLAWLLREASVFTTVALAMILGGALGNIVDRARVSVVTDFIDLHLGGTHFPTFNLADTAITVGVALLVMSMRRRHAEAPAVATDGRPTP